MTQYQFMHSELRSDVMSKRSLATKLSRDSLLISVLIAAKDEAKHIEQCLLSLSEQSYQPLEVIVIDDGSVDDTAKRARGLSKRFSRLQVIECHHAGKAAAIWTGAKIAKGDILFFLDADLVFAKDYIERMAQPIIDGKTEGTCHGREQVANSHNFWAQGFQRVAGKPDSERVVLTPSMQKEGSGVFRAVLKRRFFDVGGFDSTGFSDDQSLAPKLHGNATWVPEAECMHYNPETAWETFVYGIWCGKTNALQFGRKVFLGTLLILPLWRGIFEAFRRRSFHLMVYLAVYDAGVWWGQFSYLVLRRKIPGKSL